MDCIQLYISQLNNNVFMPLGDKEVDLPDMKGIYLICIKDLKSLPDSLKDLTYSYFNDSPVLYLGISGNRGLRKRDYRNHFNGTARVSTLRKSLGVLFGYNKVQYENDRGSTKYRFKKDQEEKLTQWMKENLIMHYCVTDDDIEYIETELINYYNPPLNLSKNKNSVNKDFRKYLSKLRCNI